MARLWHGGKHWEHACTVRRPAVEALVVWREATGERPCLQRLPVDAWPANPAMNRTGLVETPGIPLRFTRRGRTWIWRLGPDGPLPALSKRTSLALSRGSHPRVATLLPRLRF